MTKHDEADVFRKLSSRAANAFGTPWAFVTAVVVVLVWALTGPLFDFSETWQLVINTGTTIVTFLMVFLIQATQNRDTRTLHLKLDELIRVTRARNLFAALETASDDELVALEREFEALHRSYEERRHQRRHGHPRDSI